MAGNGFRPVGVLGAANAQQTRQYWIGQNYGLNIFYGDPVCMSAAGEIILGTDALILGADMVGVFLGCEYRNADGEVKFSQYYPASTNVDEGVKAYVSDNPFTLYKAKILGGDGGSDTTLDRTSIGLNIALAFTAGSTTTGNSGSGVDSTETGTTTQGFRIVDLVSDDSPANEYATPSTAYTHALVVVEPNLHFYMSTTGI